jgi:hypothetical protein
MFGRSPLTAVHARSFSTNDANDGEEGVTGSTTANGWPPRSVEQLRPPEELAAAFERQRKAMGWDGNTELPGCVSDFLEKAELCRRVGKEKLCAILENGYIESSENDNSNTRQKKVIKVQNALFGYPLELRGNRPVHAIATHDKYGDNRDDLNHFGEIGVYIKIEPIKSCLTVIATDSFLAVPIGRNGSRKLNARADPFTNPTNNIFPLEVRSLDANGLWKFTPWNPLDFERVDDMPIQYLEVQIHPILMKGNRLNVEHISRIVIRDPVNLGEEEAREMKQLCKNRGIPCDVGKSEEDSRELRQNYPWIEEVFGVFN